MKSNKKLELVVMLNGNFCVIPTSESEMDTDVKIITDGIKSSISDPYYFINYKGYILLTKYIVGFYFRIPVENMQKKAVELLEKINGEDESRKNGDDM